eukprot:gene30574-38240_t
MPDDAVVWLRQAACAATPAAADCEGFGFLEAQSQGATLESFRGTADDLLGTIEERQHLRVLGEALPLVQSL